MSIATKDLEKNLSPKTNESCSSGNTFLENVCPEGLFQYICFFLHPKEVLSLLECSKSLKEHAGADNLWTQFCLRALVNAKRGTAKQTYLNILWLKEYFPERVLGAFTVQRLSRAPHLSLSKNHDYIDFLDPNNMSDNIMVGRNMYRSFVAMLLEAEFVLNNRGIKNYVGFPSVHRKFNPDTKTLSDKFVAVYHERYSSSESDPSNRPGRGWVVAGHSQPSERALWDLKETMKIRDTISQFVKEREKQDLIEGNPRREILTQFFQKDLAALVDEYCDFTSTAFVEIGDCTDSIECGYFKVKMGLVGCRV